MTANFRIFSELIDIKSTYVFDLTAPFDMTWLYSTGLDLNIMFYYIVLFDSIFLD